MKIINEPRRFLPYTSQNFLAAYGRIVRRNRPQSLAAARFQALLRGSKAG